MKNLSIKKILTYLLVVEKSLFYRVIGNEEKEESLLSEADFYWYKLNETEHKIIRLYLHYISYYFWYIPEGIRELYNKKFKK